MFTFAVPLVALYLLKASQSDAMCRCLVYHRGIVVLLQAEAPEVASILVWDPKTCICCECVKARTKCSSDPKYICIIMYVCVE